MGLWVVRKTKTRAEWRDYASHQEGAHAQLVRAKYRVGCWDLTCEFHGIDDAIDAITKARALVGGHHRANALLFGVRDCHGRIVWTEEDGTISLGPDAPIYPQEEPRMGIPQQKLNVSKDALLARIQERKAEEEKARNDADALITARREAALAAVGKLSTDEVLNFIQRYGPSSDLDDIVEMVDDAEKTGRLKSESAKPNRVETALDKWARVLEMSSDTTIEVHPGDEVYPLL